MIRLISDQGAREPQRGQPGRSVNLIADAVSRLLRGRAVIAQPIGLDHEPEAWPVEVDFEPVHETSCLGQGKAGASNERQKAPLEL